MSETPDLTPEQEAVRRLLADARHDGPPPADVVARLDDTLASLVAERRSSPVEDGAAEAPAPVVDLAARRRRMAGIGVLAAAAVVVAGVGIGQLVPRGADSGSDSAATSQSDSALEESAAPDGSGGEAGADSSELAPEALKSPAATPFADAPSLSSSDAALDQELLALRPGATGRSPGLGSVDALGSCALPRLGQGRRLLARVDDEPGVVVYRRPDATAQVADLYVCGTPEPVRTLVLPAP